MANSFASNDEHDDQREPKSNSTAGAALSGVVALIFFVMARREFLEAEPNWLLGAGAVLVACCYLARAAHETLGVLRTR